MSRTHCGYAAAYVWYACIAYCVELGVGLGTEYPWICELDWVLSTQSNSQHHAVRKAGIPDVCCRITTMGP